jgi:hypothetical protein
VRRPTIADRQQSRLRRSRRNELVDRGIELGLLARDERERGAVLAQRASDLQAEPARSPGNQRDPTREVEQVAQRPAHGPASDQLGIVPGAALERAANVLRSTETSPKRWP